MWFKKEQEPLIEFFSTVPGLYDIEETRPQPAQKFIPDWWKNLPKQKPFPAQQTVRVCPSFPDYFSQGFILPMWADTTIASNSFTGDWAWAQGRQDKDNPFSIDLHPKEQYTDFVTPIYQGEIGASVFKLVSPWQVITPKGWSVLQLPLFYHFNKDWSVLPGIINTDVHHQINQQIMMHGDGNAKEIIIKRGTPFVQYIPFKRTKYNHVSRAANEFDKKKVDKNFAIILTKFGGSGAYSKASKKADRE